MYVAVRKPFSVGLVSLCAVVGLLAFMSAPALAATPPETPEVTVESIAPTTATFHGILNPAASEPTKVGMGTYKFLYRASKTECTGTGGKETSPSGLSLGGPHEEVFEPVTGLTQNTEYTVCLSITNLEGQTAVSAPAPFTTKDAPVTSSPAKALTSTTATLEGTLNPGTEAETGYYFAYSANGVCTEGATTTPVTAEENGEVKDQKVKAPLAGLEPNTTYTFCLVATDVQGEATVGNAVPFKTSVSKPTVISLSAPLPKVEEVRLEATVNPSNETTECHFELSRENGSEIIAPKECEQGNALEGGEQPVSLNVSGLKPNTTYHYQVQLKNATGETTREATFTTAIHPESPTGLKVEAITASTATLTGVLNPKAAGDPGSYEFIYKASAKECEGGEAAGGSALGDKEEAVEAKLTLSPNTTYTVCLRAHNEAGEESTLTAPITFTTLVAAPNIESESSTVIDATEARLEAEIDTGNSETAYHFEYGPSADSYDVSVPVVAAHTHGSLTVKSVSAAATGLAPNTTYHYRVVASNALPGEVDGPDREFTTPAEQGTGSSQNCKNEQLRAEQPFGLTLPDCRAYEMVSPEETGGQDATDSFIDTNARAAESSEKPAITYASKGSFGNPTGAAATDQFVSRRNAEKERWETQAVTPLFNPTTTTDNSSFETTLFTPELEAGIAVTSARLGEAPPLGEDVGVYVAEFANHDYSYVGQIGSNSLPWGASTDLGRVVLGDFDTESLFEWVNGSDFPVSVSNTGEEMAASAGSVEASGVYGAYKNAWHSTSADGSRVYFTTPPNLGDIGQLYVRVNIGRHQNENYGPKGECLEPTQACTIEVSASQREPEDPNGPRTARYWGASADGGKVFFTSKAELTDDANTGNPESCETAPEPSEQQGDCNANLYEYNVETGILTDLTVDAEPAGAAVQGLVQISEEGQYVYFVAKGALKGEHGEALQNASNAEPVAEKDNLYVSHEGRAPVFIATLAAKDETDWLNGGPKPELEAGPEVNTAVVTPRGTQLAFISEQSLPTANFPAGYDNEQAEAGDCKTELENHEAESGMCREVYLYDAETHGLACASCNPTGARPVGPSSIPGVVPQFQAPTSYRPRDLIEGGTLFFDSKDALVPSASNGRQNVYEYEDGAVHAISNVAGGYESFFLDASPSGEDVFFGSADQLLKQDTGDNVVVWDAREEGGFPVPPPVPSCDNGDSCKPPPSQQPSAFAPAGSATFNGLGNVPPPTTAAVTPKKKIAGQLKVEKLAKALKQCRKAKSKQKRASCEKSARKKYGPVKPKKKAKRSAKTNRRGKS